MSYRNPRSDAEFIEWFLSSFDCSGGPDACHEWQIYRDKLGYGRCMTGYRRYGIGATHRLKWRLLNGPIPEGLNVLHRCDNPPCGNLHHLFLGTHADNVTDMITKGRQAKGEHVGGAHMTENMVREIRKLKAEEGLGHRAICRRLGIAYNDSLISLILSHKVWAWLE